MTLLYIRTLPLLPEEGPKLNITEITYNKPHVHKKHHTHCSVESVAERGAAAPSLSSCVGQVDGLSKPEQRTHAAQGVDVEGTFHDALKLDAAKNPTAQYIIYNIKEMGLFKSACRPAKTDPVGRALALPLPPPVPSRKNYPQPTQHAPPSRPLSSPMR